MTMRRVLVVDGQNAFALATFEAGNTLFERGPTSVTEIEVSVIRLDDIVEDGQPVSFIKVDVEGFEAEVLAGAPRLRSAARPVLLIEIARIHNCDYRGTVHHLKALGYSMFAPRGRGTVPADETQIAAQPEHVTGPAALAVDWDFLFVPEERADIVSVLSSS